MKGLWICLALVTVSVSVSNTQRSFHPFDAQNKLFIITLDGFRWEEVFTGADSALINDKQLTGDTAISKAYIGILIQAKDEKSYCHFFGM